MDKLLDIKDLRVSYLGSNGHVHAINGVDISMNEGESLGLVGETGAGKTTLALSILQLLPERTGKIESGDIRFNGENLIGLKNHELRAIRGEKISMIFQDPMTSLNPVLTIGDQILEGLQLHNHQNRTNEEMKERVYEMLELVGIPKERYGEYPHQFSGGMRQRVVIAMALACNPELLIADEPTTALDVTIQAQVLEMISELKQKLNMGMILITHDLGIVAENCDTVATMYAGEIIEYGSAADVFDASRSHHPYTVGLFDSIPNLKTTAKRLKPITGLMPDPTDLPSGCSFHPRCAHCMDICKKEAPEAVWLSDTHMVKCHLNRNN